MVDGLVDEVRCSSFVLCVFYFLLVVMVFVGLVNFMFGIFGYDNWIVVFLG